MKLKNKSKISNKNIYIISKLIKNNQYLNP